MTTALLILSAILSVGIFVAGLFGLRLGRSRAGGRVRHAIRWAAEGAHSVWPTVRAAGASRPQPTGPVKLRLPFRNFKDAPTTQLEPVCRRTGALMREAALFKSEAARRLHLVERCYDLPIGTTARMADVDLEALWERLEGFAQDDIESSFPVKLFRPVTSGNRTISEIHAPTRPRTGADMIAEDECGSDIEKFLVRIERLCNGNDGQPLTRDLVDQLDGSDIDRCEVALVPFWHAIPGQEPGAESSATS